VTAIRHAWRRRTLRRSDEHVRLHVTYDGATMLDNVRSSRDKVRLHRERLRAQGMRPVQIWVPDVRARSFISAARKQSKAVATSKHARADQRFINAVSEDFGP
jgi:Antitoxin MazE-like